MTTKFIAIGGSLGGTRALSLILAQLSADLPIPVAVVLHRQASADSYLVTALQNHCTLDVREAFDKQAVKPGTVTIAPANYHLMIDDEHYALNIDEAVNAARPSIDLLFESVASNYNSAALGIVLTGSGTDGAKGAMAIIEAGGEVLIQDPSTAESSEMPSAALAATDAKGIYPLEELAKQIVKRCQPVGER